MQRDFHYYCVGVLARASGFNIRDSLTIAYSSQYVDDSTESKVVQLKVEKGELYFDPVRTSYGGLDNLGSLSWAAQKRVYIPFHFIPPRPFRPKLSQTFSFVTEPAANGEPEYKESFAELLVKKASRESLKNYTRRLCRIGIALHTYADSWAHQRFSGRHSQEENDVENIHLYDRESGEYKHLVLENIFLDMLPRIGHAEAGVFPDLAHLKWRYNSGNAPMAIERDNTEEFMESAKEIYDVLVEVKKRRPAPPIPWGEIEPDIRELLASGPKVKVTPADQISEQSYAKYHDTDLGVRCKGWQDKFGHLFQPPPKDDFYYYDRRRWRGQALLGDIDWDDWTEKDWDEMEPMELRSGFWDSRWVQFHRAALRQRHFVLENLP
jgi:hypothetical protein